MSSSNGRGVASDADVDTGTVSTPTADYHDQLADAAEEAAKNVERTIADLKDSLKGRQAEAKHHREAAKQARTGNEG